MNPWFRLSCWRRWTAIAGGFVCAGAGLSAQEALPAYRPGPCEGGSIRIAGDAEAATVVRFWIQGFARSHPDVKLEARLLGTDTGLSALWTLHADLALIGRDLTSAEHDGHGYAFTYYAFGVEVMNGSLGTPGKSHALVPFVRRDNPLTRITVDQLRRIFGTEQARGEGRIATWDQLGLTGEWVGKPITGYLFDQTDGAGAYFTRVILQGSTHWNWDAVKEFQAISLKEDADGLARDADEQIAKALAADRYGLGFSSVFRASDGIKPLAVAEHEGMPAYEASAETITAGTYPLARKITAYLHQPPGKPVDPKMLEFLHYILSREGQEDVARAGDFLPLSARDVREQRRRLE